MKKASVSSIVLSVVTTSLFFINFFEAYRIATLLEYDVLEIMFTYETFILEILLILSLLYIVVLIKYSDSYNKKHYVIKRIYPLVVITISILGFTLGLNLEHLMGNSEAFSYVPFTNVWMFSFILIAVLTLDIFFFIKYTNHRKKKRWIDIVQFLLTTVFIVLFNILITDSATVMGIFD